MKFEITTRAEIVLAEDDLATVALEHIGNADSTVSIRHCG